MGRIRVREAESAPPSWWSKKSSCQLQAASYQGFMVVALAASSAGLHHRVPIWRWLFASLPVLPGLHPNYATTDHAALG